MRYVPFYEVLEKPDRYNLLPQTRREVEQAARTASPRSEAPPAAVSRQPVPARTTADTPPPAPPPSGVQPAREPPATAGAAPPAAAPSAAAPPAATGPVTRIGAIEIPKEGEYRIDVTPSRGGIADEYIRSVLPPGVNINNPRAIEAAINTVPNLRERAEKEAATAQSIRDASRATDRSISDLWSLATSVNRISTNNLTGEGAGQEGRAALVNIYNTAAKIAGLPGAQIDVGSDIQETEIIRKIQELGSVQMAAQGGFNAAAVATSIRNAMPSGNLTKEAANTIISNMLVEFQRDRDFARYYDAYTRRYGTALNVYDNFNKEMGDRYDLERQRLKESMQAFPVTERVNGQTVTRRESAVDILRRDPSSSRRFDARFDTPGLARYWRTN
jgi:hypothetical protein